MNDSYASMIVNELRKITAELRHIKQELHKLANKP